MTDMSREQICSTELFSAKQQRCSKRLISLTCELCFLVSINLFSDSSLLHLDATLILTEYEIGYVKLLVGLAQWEKATAVIPCFKSASPVSLLLWDWAVYERITQLPTVARPHSQNEQVTRPCTLWVTYSNYSKTSIIFGQWLKSVRTMEHNSNSILWLHGDAAIWRNWHITTWLHSTQRNLAAQVFNLSDRKFKKV